MKTQILHIKPYDDNHSIIDKMNWGKSERILMVFPNRHKTIFRKLDLLLLQRHSEIVGAKIAIVSKNVQINYHANELAIPVFRSLRQARRLPWEAAITSAPKIFKIKERDVSLTVLKQNALPNVKYPVLTQFLPRLIFFLIGVMAFAGLLAALVPTVEITLSPKLEEQEMNLDLSANPNTTNFSPAGILPASELLITVEGRDSVKPTGYINVPQQAANGEIQFTNLTDLEVIIPIGTIVRTIDINPIRFITENAITLVAESGAVGTTTILAMNPGPASNLPGVSLIVVDGDLGLQVSAINFEPTTGGSEIASKAPTQADYDLLFGNLEEALMASAIQEAASMIGDEDLLIIAGPSSYEILEKTFSPPNPQPVPELRLKLQIEYKIMFISIEAQEAVSIVNLDAILPDGYFAKNESILVQAMSMPEFDEDGHVYWQALAKRIIYPEIKANEVRELIKGETLVSALRIIKDNFDLETAPKIRLMPSWWPRLPFIPLRITVIVE